MKPSSFFGALALVAGALLAVAGCGSADGNAPGYPNVYITPTPTPAARELYADHNGELSVYPLPLKAGEKPSRVLDEAPGNPVVQPIAVDLYGKVALATTTQIRLFYPPITTFAPSAAKLTIPLTSAITAIGSNGADLVDIEFDPNDNFWLLSDIGGDVTELQAPLTRQSVASTSIEFGAPGSKTSGYEALVQARFDINSTLYVLADNSETGALLFKSSFPYGKQPSGTGLNLAEAAFVDPSQFEYGPPAGAPGGVVLGQYFGPLASSPPLQPTPEPANVLAQFAQPFMPINGVFPNATVNEIIGALVADPPRNAFYTLDASDGQLDVYPIPLTPHAKPKISLACIGGPSLCNGKPEHLFLSP